MFHNSEYEYIKNIIDNQTKLNYKIKENDIMDIISNSGLTEHEKYFSDSNDTSIFNSSTLLHIAPHEYVTKLLKYFRCPTEHLIISIIYIKRLLKTNTIIITSKNTHYLLFIALILTMYYWDDEVYNINKCAIHCGISSVDKTNEMIIKFLNIINWDLYI